jgi:ABC-type Mn2+/Zn2+ transport system permease subunit
VASGAAIVLTTTLIFLVVFLFAPQRGLVWDLARRYAT